MPVLRGTAVGLTLGPRERRFRARTAGIQVAASTLLLAGSLFLFATVDALTDVAPGFPAHEVLEVSFDLQDRTRDSRAGATEVMSRLGAAAVAVDNIDMASFEGGLWGLAGPGGAMVEDEASPLDSRPFHDGTQLRDAEGRPVRVRVVGHDWLRTLDLGLVAGRTFPAANASTMPLPGLVTSALAERLWPDAPLGRHVTLGAAGPTVGIVGVISDRKRVLSGRGGIRVAAVEEVVLSHEQAYVRDPRLLVRTARPVEVTPALQAALGAVDARQPVRRVRTLQEEFDLTASITSSLGRLVLGLAAAGGLISAIGLFGLVAHLVAERRSEIGIRMALGAEPRAVVRAMALQGLRITSAGAAGGLVMWLALWPVARRFLYDPGMPEPIPILITLGLVGLLGWLVSFVPARRAAKVDPCEAFLMR